MSTDRNQSYGSMTTTIDRIGSDTCLQALVASHPTVAEFRQRPGVQESRSALQFRNEDLPYNLTRTTLAGPDMVSGEPYVFTNDETGSLVAFYHLGERIAGHSRMVHGGIAAMLLDECMGRACFPKLAARIGVTAKLELEYKAPISVRTNVLVRADTAEIQGRKAWVNGSIEDARDGRLLVKATALFIEPRGAENMPKVI
ncbi:HotDog domain-containing protein [Xylariaceae sp. FL1651]|nr:HotDog domain-containing protein [Xylariaceae sp. FL1651]